MGGARPRPARPPWRLGTHTLARTPAGRLSKVAPSAARPRRHVEGDLLSALFAPARLCGRVRVAAHPARPPGPIAGLGAALGAESADESETQYEKYEGSEAEGTAGWARDGRRASAGTRGRAGGRGGDTGAGAAGVGGVRAPPAARAARREAQRLLVASRSRSPRQPPAPPLLLAGEARLVRARHAALSGDTCAAAHSRPPPRKRSASSPQPARWLPTGRLPVARTHTAQHSAVPIYALL